MSDIADHHGIVALFKQADVKLPLHLSDEDIGVILDDDGKDIITVDSNGFRSDERVITITSLVAAAINMFAGFQEVEDRARIQP